jgi:hypothetical protein
LVSGARIDVSPNLVQEYDDSKDTGTVYTNYKTMTVNGVEHTIGITTAGKIVVDGISYNGISTDNVGNSKIDVFNNCALIIDPYNNSVPAKIVTFPENVADSIILDSDDAVIVEDDTMHSYGSLSDIKRFVVLNDYMALALFAGDNKLCFIILQDIATSFSAGEIIDCQEHEFPIIDFAPHYVHSDVDYAVFAYYNDGGTICFGKYDVASWFPTLGSSYDQTDFVKINPVVDIFPMFLVCESMPIANGYEFSAMAVTQNKLWWQYLNINQMVSYGDIADDEDLLFSITLDNFSGSGGNVIGCSETGWISTDIQKSKLPMVTYQDGIHLIIASGIIIHNYVTDIVEIFASINSWEFYAWIHFTCTWNGIQPYYGTVGTPYPVTFTEAQYGGGLEAESVTSTKWFERTGLDGHANRKIYRTNISTTYLAWPTRVYVHNHVWWDGAAYHMFNFIGSTNFDSGENDTYVFRPYDVLVPNNYPLCYIQAYNINQYCPAEHSVQAYNINLFNISISPYSVDGSLWRFLDREIAELTFNYSGPTSIEIDDANPTHINATGYDTIVPTETAEISGTGMSLTDGQVRYAYSFLYDGYQESPLSTDKYDTDFIDTEPPVVGALSDDYFSVSVKITISYAALEKMSKRITGINLYGARIKDGEEVELYRLIRYIPFNQYEMAINNDKTGYEVTILDYGNRMGSFDAVAGFSETLENVSIYRSVQCAFQGYVFAGDIHITSTDKKISLDNIIVRSLPLQPSVFDYTSNFAVLSFTATAMVGYNNRLYVFGEEDYAVINPDTMAIEYKSDALGCASYKFLVMTEFGIFVFFNDNVYAIDGATVIPIGNDIKISLYNAATPIVIPSLETMGVISLHYFKKRNALCVVGKDYVYLYSIPNKRWMLYGIPEIDPTTGALKSVFTSYEDSGDIHICYTRSTDIPFRSKAKQSQMLFGGATLRDIEIEQVINFGDDISKKYIYDTEILPVVADDVVKYDNVVATYPIKDKRNTTLYVKRSAGNIDCITLTYRKFVVREY